MYEEIKQKLDLTALQIRTGESYEVVLILAVYGLLYAVEKHNRTEQQNIKLQLMATDLRQVMRMSNIDDV